jgi:nucleotide-binding universal stress UspA family protein
MVQHILLATDGSESAQQAENYALQLNASCGAKLTIAHILDNKLCHYGKVDTLAPLEARESFITYVIEEQQEASKEIVKILNNKAKALNAQFELTIKQGEPVSEVAAIAKEMNADIIILGGHRSRKSRGFRSLSFADKIATLTDQNILTVV